ncbi:hypothetical protein ACP70R_008039 [Stipagrostis hirtigluma subsp. patula]
MEDGGDPRPAATGPPPPRRGIYLALRDQRRIAGPFTAQEAMDPSNWRPGEPDHGSPEESSEHSRRRPPAPAMDDAAGDPDPATRRQPRERGVEIMLGDPYEDRLVGPLPLTDALKYGRRRPGTRPRASSSAASPSENPGAAGSGTRTRVRQSVLYSDRPRRSRNRRERAMDEEPAGMVSSSEVGRAATDLSSFEALSISDSPVSIPQTAEETEETDDDMPFAPVPKRNPCLFRSKGVTRSMMLSLWDSMFITVSTKEQPRPHSDKDPDKLRQEMKEYLDAQRPCGSVREAFDRIIAKEHATLTALAAEWGTDPPSVILDALVAEQGTEPLQAPQQASAAAAHPQHSMAPREPSHDVSNEKIIENGKTWMSEEVMLSFEKYIERRADLSGLEYHLGELSHQCFNVENYNKVFHHYNFTVRMKKPCSSDWTVELYFAEVKECHCYACKSQGVEDLKHPATGGFETGSPDAPVCNLWYTDE